MTTLVIVMTLFIVSCEQATVNDLVAPTEESPSELIEMEQLESRNGCQCSSPGNFGSNLINSENSVKVFVLSFWPDCSLCSGNNNNNLIRRYALLVRDVYKSNNLSKDDIIYAQSFDNLDYCGVRLVPGKEYLLNLSNLSSISAGSHWDPTEYVLDACDGHYDWQNWMSADIENYLGVPTSTCYNPFDFNVDTEQTSARVTWAAVPNAIKHKIKYKQVGGNWVLKNNIRNPQTNLPGLQSNKDYKYKVATKCPDGWTGFSPALSFRTD